MMNLKLRVKLGGIVIKSFESVRSEKEMEGGERERLFNGGDSAALCDLS